MVPRTPIRGSTSQGRAIQNSCHKVRTFQVRIRVDNHSHGVLFFFRCRIRSAGRYPKIPAQSIILTICNRYATKRPKGVMVQLKAINPQEYDVSQTQAIPNDADLSGNHASWAGGPFAEAAGGGAAGIGGVTTASCPIAGHCGPGDPLQPIRRGGHGRNPLGRPRREPPETRPLGINGKAAAP